MIYPQKMVVFHSYDSDGVGRNEPATRSNVSSLVMLWENTKSHDMLSNTSKNWAYSQSWLPPLETLNQFWQFLCVDPSWCSFWLLVYHESI